MHNANQILRSTLDTCIQCLNNVEAAINRGEPPLPMAGYALEIASTLIYMTAACSSLVCVTTTVDLITLRESGEYEKQLPQANVCRDVGIFAATLAGGLAAQAGSAELSAVAEQVALHGVEILNGTDINDSLAAAMGVLGKERKPH